MKFRRVRGTQDLFGDKLDCFDFVKETAVETAKEYGFREIVFPVIEFTELFVRSVGETSDVVRKEMFTFEDRKGRSLTLRPEGTASVVRAVVENGLLNLGSPLKLFYFGPMFRAERPQAGRWRQFHQFGVEVFGNKSPESDAEVILLFYDVIGKLGIESATVRLNTVGCENCRDSYRSALRDYLKPNLDKLCDDCNYRYHHNVLRTLDCKNPSCQPVLDSAPHFYDYVCDECRGHFDRVVKLLKGEGVNFVIDHRLVRGFDYYSRTAFEIVVEGENLGSQNAVAGGGRYDYLVEDFGGPRTPAVGGALGVERLMMAVENCRTSKTADVYFTFFESVKDTAFSLVQKLRAEKVSVITDWDASNISRHLKKADRFGVKYSIILGEDELKNGEVIVRDMVSGKQEKVKIDRLVDTLKSRFLRGER